VFYVLLALAVTASVQLVGVFLVFASLIIPALAAHALRPARRLAAAYAIGTVGYAAGIAGSALVDLPTSALVIWAMAVAGLAVAVGSRKW
jgi:zinc/manganese transport system permease protein